MREREKVNLTCALTIKPKTYLVMEDKDAKEECVKVSCEQREVDDQSTGEPHHLRHHSIEEKLGHSKASKQKTFSVCMSEKAHTMHSILSIKLVCRHVTPDKGPGDYMYLLPIL